MNPVRQGSDRLLHIPDMDVVVEGIAPNGAKDTNT
jgi:hypothetical protein